MMVLIIPFTLTFIICYSVLESYIKRKEIKNNDKIFAIIVSILFAITAIGYTLLGFNLLAIGFTILIAFIYMTFWIVKNSLILNVNLFLMFIVSIIYILMGE